MIISHAVIAGGSVDAECSFTLMPGSWQPVTVTISGGIATASIPRGAPALLHALEDGSTVAYATGHNTGKPSHFLRLTEPR